MKSIASRVGLGVVIAIIAYFGLKSFVFTLWSSPKDPTTYSIVGGDGRILSVIFLPKHETLFVYSADGGKNVEVNLSDMKGTYGTHYFWRLWSVEGPGRVGGFFGFRIYPEGFQPVVMEATVKKKFIHGTHTPVFPQQGARTHPVILFAEHAIEFEGMVLDKHATDDAFLADILPKLRQ